MAFMTRMNSLVAGIFFAALFSFSAVRAEVPTEAAGAADAGTVKGSVAVFYVPQEGAQLNALAEKAAQTVIAVFDEMGRFLPVEHNALTAAVEKLGGEMTPERYEELAKALDVDLYVVIVVYQRGNRFQGQLSFVPLKNEYARLKKTIQVSSRVVIDVPLLLARETALLHEGLPLRANVIGTINGLTILDAGQWHGLSPGEYRTVEGETFRIVRTDRYQSLARLPEKPAGRTQLVIAAYPRLSSVIRQINADIEDNLVGQYGLRNTLLKGTDDKRRYMEGMCLVNPGASFCIPVYGSHLAVGYLGFTDLSPSIPGMALTAALLVTHFMLGPMMEGFKPGLSWNDHPEKIWNLQIFLWSTIPVVWTVGYLDQLAHQFKLTEHLPPFFRNRNIAALGFSLLIPGGGLFYKGYRLGGWGFYFAEMPLLGFAVYSLADDPDASLYTFIAFGCVKLADMLVAFFLKPGYDFFNADMEGRARPVSLSFGFDVDRDPTLRGPAPQLATGERGLRGFAGARLTF